MEIKAVHKNEGEIYAVAGGNYRIIISGNDTNGAYAVIEMLVPPGGGPNPHTHPQMQEMFYLVEGELEFKTEAGKSIIQAGGFVNIPLGGGIHCFKNISEGMARMICTVVPAGLDDLFREIGEPVAAGTFLPPRMLSPEQKAALDKKYNQTTYPPDYLG